MKAALALALCAALALPAVPAMAWQAPRPVAPQAHHQPHSKPLPPRPQLQPVRPHHAARPQPGRPMEKAPRAPRIGEYLREARPFRPTPGPRFRAPPRGQEYRVANDHLVLVNSRTLQVVAVVGLLSALLR
ncbi:hypothetical protein [Falsigemmobacter faecalis]|uniref:DUF1236 domain-containing protein n=1 Tax=Falsigemmobacter faecalis TaxID=2488730 RepID=A0A3P3DPX9_9RHOB|nr:hypothetical protein [Falsigemmobacter faecalis]RRH74708.1 hypothetical protein EG244_09385 [Falsigemmobacter faecalis]